MTNSSCIILYKTTFGSTLFTREGLTCLLEIKEFLKPKFFGHTAFYMLCPFIMIFNAIQLSGDVVMSIPPASLKYLQYTFPPSRRFMINFLLVTCPYESAYAWQWRTLPKLCFCCLVQSSSIRISKRKAWSVKSNLDGSRLNFPPENSSTGQSRLTRVLKDLQMKLSAKVQEIKTAFPMKLLFFLVGFYCATAFATVIGQTGDWDVLSAGLAVIVVEGIGALMYNSSFPLLGKIKSLISMFNYWKAGLTLGLFLDAFKYETDNILGLTTNPFNFDIDVFQMFF